jgi:flagellar protein FliL
MAVSAVKKAPPKDEDADTGKTAVLSTQKRGKYLKLLAIIVLAIGAFGGATYWYLNQNKSHKSTEAKSQPAQPPVYVSLEPFTVNLQLEDSPQFLQTGLSLKVSDNTIVDALKVHMPEVRDRVLLLLSSRKASALLTVDGKRKLSADIVDAINSIIAPQAPKVTPAVKAPGEAAPPAEGEASAAEGDEKSAQEAATPAATPAPQLPILSVLFTSFIVQ